MSVLPHCVLGLVLFLLSGCAHGGLTSPDKEHWRRLQNAHLVLTTNLDERDAREAFLALEDDVTAIHAAFAEPATTGAPVNVVVFATFAEFDVLFRLKASGFASVLHLDPARPILVLYGPVREWVDANRRTGGESSVARHELTHVMSRHRFAQQPLWFGEGLAGYLEPLRRDPEHPGLVTFGGPHEARLSSLWRSRSVPHILPVARLLTDEAHRDDDFYPSAWLFVHYLVNAQPALWARFLSELEAVTPIDEAVGHLTQALGMEHVDKDLHAYARRGAYKVSRRPVEPSLPPEPVPLTDLAWAELRARLLSLSHNPRATDEAIREGLALDPGSEALRRLALSTLNGRPLEPFVDEWAPGRAGGPGGLDAPRRAHHRRDRARRSRGTRQGEALSGEAL